MKMHPLSQKILTGAVLTLSLTLNLQAGSLWVGEANNEQGMFADRRARNIGDLVTIVIQESTVTTKSQETKTNDSGQGGFKTFLGGLLNQFISAGTEAVKLASGAKGANVNPNSTAAAFSGVTIPSLDPTAKSDFTGGGSTTSRLTVTNRTTVTVVDVLPNGNLVVEGAKVIRLGTESQYAYMRGIVRQFDVQRDNTVLSTNIADARVEFIPEGELTEAEKKGWLSRIYEKIKPF